MLKKSLAVLMVLVMVLSFASMTAFAAGNTCEAIKGTPTIDAKMEDMWKQAKEYSLDSKIPDGEYEVSDARFRVMWDETHVYIWAEVDDEYVWAADPEGRNWLCDSIYVMLKENNKRDEKYIEKVDKDFSINADGLADTYYDDDDSHWNAKAIKTQGEGFVIEGAITLVSIKGAEGTEVGFDVNLNDVEYIEVLEENTKIGGSFWNDTTGNAWMDPQVIGTLKMVAAPAPGSEPAAEEEAATEESGDSSTLPETGVDTTILYAVAVLTLAAGAFIAVRKHASAK